MSPSAIATSVVVISRVRREKRQRSDLLHGIAAAIPKTTVGNQKGITNVHPRVYMGDDNQLDLKPRYEGKL
jgi:hypothetical protein